jgi:P4 family phage/plasmid primase-like protien
MAGGRLQDFLTTYRVEKGADFTHTSLGKPAGSFYIPVDALNTFYAVYIEALESGRQELHLTEKHRHIAPLLVDLDFRFEAATAADADEASTSEGAAAPPLPKRRYTQAQVEAFIELYMRAVCEWVDVPSSVSEIEVFLLEKPSPSMAIQGGASLEKDGIHIMVPSVVTKPSLQYCIRDQVLASMDQAFGTLEGLANTYADVFDQAVVERNNWLMYGSRKPGGAAYAVTRVYRYDPTARKLLVEQPRVAASPYEANELVELLSIRNKYVERHVKIEMAETFKSYEQKMEQEQQRRQSMRHMLSDVPHDATNETTNIALVEKLVQVLNPVRSNSYQDWIRLGWCLRNIDHRLLEAWDAFSKQSNKYVEGECARLWNHMRLGGLGMGTLCMWAKHDQPEAYKEILRTDLQSLIERSYRGSPTHHDIAKVVHQMYRYEYVCASIRHRAWYEYRGHRWHASDSAHSLSMRISNEVCQEYLAQVGVLQRQAAVCTSEDDLKRIGEHIKRCTDIAVKLRTTSFKENVLKECALLFYQEKFEEKLDSQSHLVCFENGVYDLDAQEFRDGHTEDYLSFTTGNAYVPYDPHHPQVQAVHRYLEQVLPKKHIRDYVLKVFSSYLHGAIRDQKFHIWTGTGSNSKSKLVELFEKAFGDYCCKFPVTMLTGKRPASSAANPELARAKGKRFACLQEPSEDERLNIGYLKELSAGDAVMARPLYRDPFDFRPQFKLLLLCNHLPHVPSDDGGTWRRIRVVEFTSKFVENPVEEHEYPIDLDLSEKMEHWREHFMALLIDTYQVYLKEGIQEPEEVVACTREYKRKNDHLGDFIHNCVEPCPGAFLSLNDAFSELKTWIKDDNIPMKPTTKSELEKYLHKNLVKTVTHGAVKGYRNFRLRNRYQMPSADLMGIGGGGGDDAIDG